MAYTTKAKAAALAGDLVSESDIQDEWLTWADELIDNWRGDDYPLEATAVTENVDGTGSDTLYLSRAPISGVTSVSIDDTELASDAYAWYKAGYLRRKTSETQYISPYLVSEVWPEGVQNVEVVYTPEAYANLLDAAAAQIVSKMAIFAANGGALKSGGFTVGDYSEKGGVYFGNAGLDGDIQAILEAKLPKRERWSFGFSEA